MNDDRTRIRITMLTLFIAFAFCALAPADAAAPAPASAPANPLDLIRQRQIAVWCETANVERAKDAVNTIRDDGTWADIDYADHQTVGWKPAPHLLRMSSMAATARKSGTTPQDAEKLLAAAGCALDGWLAHDPQCANWWNNQIGTPWEVAKSMILLGDQLTAKQRAEAAKILDRARIGMTGENLVWLARNNIYRGLLENDEKRVADAFSRIWAEIRDDLKEGVQPDGSFHQHGAQLYVGGYGSGFMDDTTTLMGFAAGTPMAAPPDKVKIVERYLLDGVVPN